MVSKISFPRCQLKNLLTGRQVVHLPPPAQTTSVQLQWRAVRSAEWSMDNVRIGSDALLYNLQFDIQVGNCLPPPINGSVSDYVKLEYYDGTSWSLLQNECLHSKCLLMVSNITIISIWGNHAHWKL